MRPYLEDTKEADLISLWTFDSLLSLLEKLVESSLPQSLWVPLCFTSSHVKLDDDMAVP